MGTIRLPKKEQLLSHCIIERISGDWTYCTCRSCRKVIKQASCSKCGASDPDYAYKLMQVTCGMRMMHIVAFDAVAAPFVGCSAEEFVQNTQQWPDFGKDVMAALEGTVCTMQLQEKQRRPKADSSILPDLIIASITTEQGYVPVALAIKDILDQ